MDKSELLTKIKKMCKVRDLEFQEYVYIEELDNAIEVVNERRGFTPTEENEYEKKYSNLLCRMVVYSLSKMGAEGQMSHSENGISRTYKSAGDYPSDIMNQIIPLVKA